MDNFFKGFYKEAGLPSKAVAAWGGLAGALMGTGLGMMTRAKFEEKFKDDKDKGLKDALIGKAPLLLGLMGAIPAATWGYRKGKRVENFIEELRQARGALRDFDIGMHKKSALLPSVTLKDHQIRANQKAMDNDGSLLIAHATGSGKTLTGISTFEKLKSAGKAKKAIVVVPAALRENFVDNLRRFTNSTYTVFGPKAEKSSRNVEDQSSTDYNIVSYELFREHGDKLIQNTGADTIILDEIHRARGTEGSTYNKLRELRPRFKNAITMTGSVVNNEPNDIVPLMDVTYGHTGHKLVSKTFFDKLFVQKDAKTRGLLFPKVEIVKGLKNKPQLAKYLGNKVDFISHKDLEKDLPAKELHTVEVPMTKEQKKIYDFALSSVDPITRWKIRNNLPVSQREAKDAFGKLMQARQISTDPATMDKRLEGKDPTEYSPKVKEVLKDIGTHLGENSQNKVVVFGNLLQGQLNGVEKALKNKGIPYSKFIGLGNEGQTAKTRPKEVQDFTSGTKRVLLISGAGAEGLDLKNATMMQMLEGHYNPERLHQAESRVRRLGGEHKKVIIKRYLTQPTATGTQKLLSKILSPVGLGGAHKGVDSWIYSIAANKDRLNEEFRDVLQKTGSFEDSGEFSEDIFSHVIASDVGAVLGKLPAMVIAKRRDKDIEAKLKQMLLDRGAESLTKKMHYDKILAESKIDERTIDAEKGVASLLLGAGMLLPMMPGVKSKMTRPVTKALEKVLPKGKKGWAGVIASAAPAAIIGAAMPILGEQAKTMVTRSTIGGGKDLDIGMQRYLDKLRKKMERKYKSSKGFVNEYETKQELGIDQVSGV